MFFLIDDKLIIMDDFIYVDLFQCFTYKNLYKRMARIYIPQLEEGSPGLTQKRLGRSLGAVLRLGQP